MKRLWLFLTLLSVYLVCSCTLCVVPVWEDFTVWPSGAWLRAINPVFGVFLKFSPPKLNFSSAFCQTISRAVKHGVHQAQHTFFLSVFQIAVQFYLQHTGGVESLIPQILRDIKSHTEVITWKQNEKDTQSLCYLRSTTDGLHNVYFKLLKSRTAETSTIFGEGNLAIV